MIIAQIAWIFLLSLASFCSTSKIDMLVNQTLEEQHYLKFHICRDAGEAYSASYLITKHYLLERNTVYNLTWVNCEMASFIMMNQNGVHGNNKSGTIVQSLDVLDFSVIHLSAFERLEKRHSYRFPKGKRHSHTMPVMQRLSEYSNKHYRNTVHNYSYNQLRTVAIMPFAGNVMGSGHSNLGNRYEYLRSCLLSVAEHIPNIIVSVLSKVDYDFVR